MTENTQTTVADTTSSRGAQWAGAGSLIAIAAQSLLNGGIGGIFGGGGTHTAAQAANTAVAIELAKKDAEIALLKAGQETDAKLVDVYTTLRSQDKAQDEARAALAAQVGGIDKRVTALEVSAPLREQIVLGKVGEVATMANSGIMANSAAITNLANTVAGITKCIVPSSAVCPQPMPLYNSWTTPTGPTA